MDKTSVLVVDDELDTLNLLKVLLEVSGFEPITTINSVEALALAELEDPDVILLDIMMPKIDGFALCKMMRQHPELKDRPIIFVTAYEALDLEDRREEAGADAVVNKPIDMNVLTTTINKVYEEKPKSRPSRKPSAPAATQEKPAQSASSSPTPETSSEAKPTTLKTEKPTPSTPESRTADSTSKPEKTEKPTTAADEDMSKIVLQKSSEENDDLPQPSLYFPKEETKQESDDNKKDDKADS